VKLAESLELIGKRWNILEKLSEKKYYVSELAEELGKKTPEISKNLKELEKNELVECEQKEGDRRKYYHISDYTKNILTAVTQASQSKSKEKLEEWQINEFLSVLEDEDLSDTLRVKYSKSFQDVCNAHQEEVISHKGAQRLFMKVAVDPFHDKITEALMLSLSALLRGLRKEWSDWALRKLYPIFAKEMEDIEIDERIRVWAIIRVGELAGSGIALSLKDEAEKKFLKIWCSNDTDPQSKLGIEVEQQLVNLASRALFEKVRARAKDQDLKVKAEILLERLTECLLPARARKIDRTD